LYCTTGLKFRLEFLYLAAHGFEKVIGYEKSIVLPPGRKSALDHAQNAIIVLVLGASCEEV